MKTIVLSFCLVLTTLGLIAQVRSGEEVVIDQKVVHDLYVAAGRVTINAPVDGDLIVAGGTVIVNDTVTQDILVTGGKISLSGFVGDDVRCGGGNVELEGLLSGDFVVAGGKVSILKNAVVSGNLLSGGGEVTLDGIVKGNVSTASGTFTLNGIAEQKLACKGGKIVINGTVDGNAELAAEVIELGPDAKFSKDVSYWNKDRSLDFKNSLKGGQATFDPGLEIEDGKWHYLGFASFIMLSWYLGTAIVMLLLIQYLFSLTLKNAANTIKNNSVKSLGVGLLFIVGVPVAIVITFITLIGVPLAMLTLVAYITCILLATVVVALLISNWINNTFYQSTWKNGRIVATAFGIFIFLKLASLTPVTGPLIMFLLVCMAFGGLLLNVKWRRNKALELT
jgi:cytoskeletal protein CcmA (bactofilin family)